MIHNDYISFSSSRTKNNNAEILNFVHMLLYMIFNEKKNVKPACTVLKKI